MAATSYPGGEPSGWHLDKKVPIALIVTLFIYGGTFLWWASGITHRIQAIEAAVSQSADQQGRIIRLETQYDSIAKALTRIEDKLDSRPLKQFD
jgi:hypothetical protein